MKIGAAAALVGAVVAEVTKSEDGGLGARLLAGSYYGQTVQIWAALFTAAALSAALVGLIGLASRASCCVAWRSRHERARRRSRAAADCSASPCWRCGRPACALLGVPAIILPAPSAILLRLVTSVPTLAADFVQTIRGVLAGYALGCGRGARWSRS